MSLVEGELFYSIVTLQIPFPMGYYRLHFENIMIHFEQITHLRVPQLCLQFHKQDIKL